MRLGQTAVLFAMILQAGCGPTLQRSETFTPKRVRAAIFTDECRLQNYFDRGSPPLALMTDQNVSADSKLAWGRATYVAQTPVQQRALVGVLRRTYRRLKLGSTLAKTLQIEVRYHILQGRRQVPIGARTVIRGLTPEPLDLPYHPCIGAFVFGRHTYSLRQKLEGTR